MTASEIADALARNAELVVLGMCPHAVKDGSFLVLGDRYGARGHSLKINLVGQRAGRWTDWATGEYGDLLDLWGSVTGKGLPETLQEARKWLGLPDARPALSAPRSVAHAAPLRRREARPAEDGEDAFVYLRSRKLTAETIAAYKVASRPGSVLFEFWDRDNVVRMVKELKIERQYGKKDIRPTSGGQRPSLFGWQAIPADARTVVITEGEIDAMTMWQYGYPALSVPYGGGAGKKQEWIEHEFDALELFDEVFLALDDDAEGESAVLEISSRLGRHRTRVVRLPCKDANACLMGGVTREEIDAAIKAARSIDPEELRSPTDYAREVHAYVSGEHAAAGLPLPFAKAADKFRIRPGEVTVWGGISGHGKSLLLGQVILHLASLGSPGCIASFEMPPALTLARMVKQAGNVGRPSALFTDAILEWMGGKVYLFESARDSKASRIETLFEVATYARRRYGVRQFVVDSLMKLGVNEDDYNRQKELVSDLCDLAKDEQIHVHIVMHPRKGLDEKSPPGKLDVKGSGAMTDLAWNVMTVWRNKPKEEALRKLARTGELPTAETLAQPDSLLICSKQRVEGWEGTLGLWMNAETQRYRGGRDEQTHSYVEWSRQQ